MLDSDVVGVGVGGCGVVCGVGCVCVCVRDLINERSSGVCVWCG